LTPASLRVATAVAETGLPKEFRRGTHRTVPPSETLARFRPFASQMGITRLGNITGLDRIGIPVVVAVRPNSRSVSVSQGKGLDLTQAMASALMEAIEGFHAEEVGEDRCSTYREIAAEGAVVDPLTLCSTGRPFDADAEICWLEGYDLLRQEPCRVPAELVHTDYTQPLDGYFLAGSNGLASGNHLVEAIGSAICELVERDAVALWSASGIRARARRALDITSVDDPDCRALLAKYAEAGIDVRLWNVTTEIGIAAFVCDIRDLSEGDPRRLRRFSRRRLSSRPDDCSDPRAHRGGADPSYLHRGHPRRSVAGGIRGTAQCGDRRLAARRATPGERAPFVPGRPQLYRR